VAFRAGQDVKQPLIDLHWFSRTSGPRRRPRLFSGRRAGPERDRPG
jgi:hypothetical protein